MTLANVFKLNANECTSHEFHQLRQNGRHCHDVICFHSIIFTKWFYYNPSLLSGTKPYSPTHYYPHGFNLFLVFYVVLLRLIRDGLLLLYSNIQQVWDAIWTMTNTHKARTCAVVNSHYRNICDCYIYFDSSSINVSLYNKTVNI